MSGLSSPLADRSELLHRQIHPNFCPGGEPMAQAFIIRSKNPEDNRLSVDRGSLVSSDEAFANAIARGQKTAGVCSVTVGECTDLGLAVYPDPLPENPAHAELDMSRMKRKEIETVAKQLMSLGRPRWKLLARLEKAEDPSAY